MNQSNLKLAIFGPQGSGKGTQADLLSKQFKIPHISTGEILRQEIKRKTAFGRRIEKYVLAGVLTPQGVINQIIKKRLQQNDCKKGFVLDGYPRSLTQARFLNKIIDLDKAILVHINKREVLRRLSSRRTCLKCGAVFNIVFNKPKKQGLCDKCQTELIQRKDERPAVIKKRLAVYEKQTKPVIELYKKSGILVKINGEQSIKAVFKDILKILR